MKKLICSIMLSAAIATGAGSGAWYADQEDPSQFNKQLFYSNEAVVRGADPSTIWVSEEEHAEDGGYFYSYVTGSSTINAYRSNNLSDWQYLGGVFRPNLDVSWAYMNYWAPSVRYDAESGKYLMFYSACWKAKRSYNGMSGLNRFYLSLAVSDSPAGPFVEYTDDNKGENEPLIDFANIPKESPLFEEYVEGAYENGYLSAIDAESFLDPVTGKKYLLFCHDKAGAYSASTIWIMEMENWTTPCYDKITPLTENGVTMIGGTEEIEEGTVNEGPFMYYRNGTYYLTYSVYTYNMSQYQVRQAVASSPTGPFRKIAYEDGGAVLTTDGLGVYTNSSGHASIIDVDGEPYISYHTFLNDEDLSQSRKIRFDKISFVTNSEGIEVMYANGPTVTPQYLPEGVSGYRNIASEAYVSVRKMQEGGDAFWLTDGTLKAHTFSVVEEVELNRKGRIDLAFDDYKTVRAVVVYNSRNWDKAFTSAIVTFTYLLNGEEERCSTKELQFNFDRYSDQDYKIMFVGGSVAAEFAELQVKSISVVFESDRDTIAIPEIVVLGKGDSV